MNGAAALARNIPPEILRILALACFSAAFLSASGAFDTEAAALLPRQGYWLLMAFICTIALEGCHRGLTRRANPMSPWRVRAAGLALLVFPLTIVALLACKLVFGGTPDFASFWALLPGMIGVLTALQLVLGFSAPVAPPSGGSGALRGLGECLPPPLRSARIYALSAEDHYVRVHTSGGQALVRMRFADAVAAVPEDKGLQLHRSWWVAHDSIVEVRRSKRRTSLTLVDGQQVPVSRKYANRVGRR